MTRAFDYTDEAITDLAQIWWHYAVHVSIRVADETVNRIVATISRTVTKHPLSGRARPELGLDVRSFFIAPYIVLYRVRQRRVEAVRVLHGHRDVRPPLTSLLVAV